MFATDRAILPMANELQVLLFTVSMPAYVQLLASKHLGDVLSVSDWVVSVSLISLVVFEFIADGAQWSKSCRINPT